MLTPIHRALGIEPGNLTMNDINQVIAEKVEETADLDWKESVYDNRDPNWSEEAAKDIAAMANSGGGWIVFGIGDDRKNNAASSVNPIQWAAGNERKILNVAYSKIGPPVVGVEFFKIPCGENPNEGYVVLMHVPDSADAPHFARKGDDAFRAPRRNGSHTVFMTDRDIERGFRERFQRGVEQEKTLQGYFEQAAEALNPEQGVFLAIAAVPVTSRTSAELIPEAIIAGYKEQLPIPDLKRSNLMELGIKISWNKYPTHIKNFRKWIIRNKSIESTAYSKKLHDDGSLECSYQFMLDSETREDDLYYPVGAPNHCRSIDIEEALIDFISLLRAHAQERQTYGGFNIRAALVGSAENPIIIRAMLADGFTIGSEKNVEPIKRFQPVSTYIDPLAPIEDILPPLRTLALDIVNQGGIQNLQVIAGEES